MDSEQDSNSYEAGHKNGYAGRKQRNRIQLGYVNLNELFYNLGYEAGIQDRKNECQITTTSSSSF